MFILFMILAALAVAGAAATIARLSRDAYGHDGFVERNRPADARRFG